LTTEEIDALERIEDALRSDAQAAKLGIPFKRGQLVKVKNNLLGWQGPIIKIDDRRNLMIEIPLLLGRATNVWVAASELEAI
jgi:hypothetical protein